MQAGKRLAEHNRLKKLEAKNKESKEKIITQEEEPKEEPKEENTITEKPVEVNIYKTSNILYLVLTGMIGGGIYIYQKKMKTSKKETKTKEEKIEPKKRDPFFME